MKPVILRFDVRFHTIILLLLFLVPFTVATGVRGPSEERRIFTFEPNMEINIDFSLYGAEQLDLVLQGSLLEYAEVIDPDPNGGPRTVELQMRLPEYLPPGEYIIRVGALEERPGGMVGGRAGALMGVTIKVLSEEPAIKSKLDVEYTAVNVNSTTAHLRVESWSKQDMVVFADLIATDPNGVVFDRIRTEEVLIPSNAIHFFMEEINTEGLVRGYYPVRAIIYYETNVSEAKSGFLVGTKDLILRDYTKQMSVGGLNRFTIRIQSDWNQDLERVEAELLLNGSSVGRSPTISVGPFRESELELFVDAKTLVPGYYEGTLVLNFDGVRKVETIPIDLLFGQTEAVQPQAPESNSHGMLLYIYLALAVLVLINLFLIFRPKKK